MTRTKSCKSCHKMFMIGTTKRQQKKMFCSGTYAKRYNGKNNKGRKRSLEFKNYLSKKFSGEGNPFYGKTHTYESKEKIAKSQLPYQIARLKNVHLSDTDKEILDGILLADGHLDASVSSLSARLTYGCKFKNTLIQIKHSLSSLKFGPIWFNRKEECYHFKSHSYKNLLDYQKKWYNGNTKIVPKDVKITPLSCYWWVAGDGKPVDYGFILCTDSFSNSENEFLAYKLTSIGFKTHVIARSKNTSHRIRVEGYCALLFLRWIKKYVKIGDQYMYKWTKSRFKKGECP